jgi:hypothetical protein
MRTIYQFVVSSPEGIGGEPFYSRVVAANSESELFALKRQFALDTGTMLDSIKVTVYKNNNIS